MNPPFLSVTCTTVCISQLSFCHLTWAWHGQKLTPIPCVLCRWAISPAAPDLRVSKAAAMYMKLRSFQGNDLIIDVLQVSTAHTHQVKLTLIAQIRCHLDMTISAQINCCIAFCTLATTIQISFGLHVHIDCCRTSQGLYTQSAPAGRGVAAKA